MCAIVGLSCHRDVNTELYDALTVLQHRGQDAAGIVTSDGRRLHLRKDLGLVREVFQTRHMMRLRGNVGIGHLRYPTAGHASSAEAQPFYVNAPFGITLAHNGNLVNSDQLTEELFDQDLRHINTDSDSEVLLNVFAHELWLRGREGLTPADIFAAVERVHQRCRGAYAAVATINGYGLVAFRDPLGIRPVSFGRRESPDGRAEYMVASESVALDALGFELMRDIAIRFNPRYGDPFVVPEAAIPPVGARIVDLQEPTRKMSTTGGTEQGTLTLLDDPARLRKKVMSAVTDSDGEVRYDLDAKPGVSGLLSLLSAVEGVPIPDLEARYAGSGYGDFKKDVAEQVIALLEPLQARHAELAADPEIGRAHV